MGVKTVNNPNDLCVLPFSFSTHLVRPGSQLTSSGFSLVILAAITWPRGSGMFFGPSKSMGVSPHGSSPYSTRSSLIRWRGTPIAIYNHKIISTVKCTYLRNSPNLKQHWGKDLSLRISSLGSGLIWLPYQAPCYLAAVIPRASKEQSVAI